MNWEHEYGGGIVVVSCILEDGHDGEAHYTGEFWWAPEDACPETVEIQIDDEGHAYWVDVQCRLPKGHEAGHLHGGIRWLMSDAGRVKREARRHVAEAKERARQADRERWSAMAANRESDESRRARGAARIREWVTQGGQLTWRLPSEVTATTGQTLKFTGTTAHVWLGNETLCARPLPIGGELYSHMPDREDIVLCGNCRIRASRRNLPDPAVAEIA